jgi:prepilin-type N-terminal cleavage/methylation domain-containing protein
MTPARARNEHGFTLVEVMVAMTLLLVGVLGTVTMIDGANAVTGRTKGREAATALGRSVLEIARGVQYKDLTPAKVLEELSARPGLADSQGGVAGHQIASRNFVYTVTPTVCSMDDPKDNLGSHAEPALTFCPESSALSGGAPVRDRNPDDYRRIGVQLTWTSDAGRIETLVQRGLITNPVGGLGPSVTKLSPDTPNTTTITTSVTSAAYDVTTSTFADTVGLTVNGARLGDAIGEGTAWEFAWDLGDPNAPKFVDCTYVLQAEAFDEEGRAGAPSALTVTLNRRRPFAPSTFAGGRNLNGARVDLQWNKSPECDVKQYRVYRGTAPGSIATLVCTVPSTASTDCVDETAPSGVTLYYQVVALDTPSGGGDREGDRSGTLTVGDEATNTPPTAPPTLTVCTGGQPDCNDIDGNPASSGLPVLSWKAADDPDGIQFYRVYRGGNTYDHRLDVLFPVANKPLVFIDDTATSSYDYYVSAVDVFFGESALTGPVSWP